MRYGTLATAALLMMIAGPLMAQESVRDRARETLPAQVQIQRALQLRYPAGLELQRPALQPRLQARRRPGPRGHHRRVAQGRRHGRIQ